MSRKLNFQNGSFHILILLIVLLLVLGILTFLFFSNTGSFKDRLFSRFFPEPTPIKTEVSSQPVSPPESIPGEIIIKFKPLTQENIKQAILESYGLVKKDLPSGMGTDVLVVEVAEKSKDTVIDALQKNPAVEYAAPSYVVKELFHTSGTEVNDPLTQSGLQWNIPKIGAPAAWHISQGSASNFVAVIDSGVNSAHADLAGKILFGYNFVDNNTDTSDKTGHGTKVTGVISALTNNATGVASLGWNTKVMPIIAVNDTGGVGLFEISQGVTYAADNGAKVVNISSGAPGISDNDAPYVQDAIDYAWGRGLVIAGAAGNGNVLGIAFPALLNNILAVGGTRSDDTKALFSNWGPEMDIVAPGEGIYTTEPGGSYTAVSGTSFSSPHVAALAALIMSANPSLTNQQVVAIIKNTSVDLGASGWDEIFGCGRINAELALKVANGTMPPPLRPAPCDIGNLTPDTEPPAVNITQPLNGATVQGTLTVSASASDNTSVNRVEFYTNSVLSYTDTQAPYDLVIDTIATGLPNGNYTFIAKAFDGAGNNTSSSPITVNVNNTADTTLPLVSITSPTASQSISGIFNIQASASDNIGVTKVTFKVDGQFLSEDTSFPYTASWDTGAVSNSTHTIEAIAVDAAGNNSTPFTVTVNVSNGACPAGSAVYFIQPSAGATISGNYIIKASASHPSGINKVEFYINGTLSFTDTTSPYEFTSNTTLLSNGSYPLSLKAYSRDGKTNSPPAITVNILN